MQRLWSLAVEGATASLLAPEASHFGAADLIFFHEESQRGSKHLQANGMLMF